jgi:hypothetical protein
MKKHLLAQILITMKHGRVFAALLLSVLLIPSTEAQDTDVVFIVDGSGSISSADWELQKTGIVAALDIPSRMGFVPLDGSIAITVVQFSSSAKIEVPYMRILKQQDLDFVVDAVTNMVQINGGTGPGEGILTATSAIINLYRPSANQTFCLTTDGTRNTGTATATAIDIAKSSAFKLDTFSVIAIDAQGLQAIFEAEYGSLVFGGGDLFIAQNTVEFANTVGNLCFPGSAELVGMEVTQVIQDLKNSVRLVAKKDTIVRTYFQPLPGGPSSVTVKARLIGRRGGVVLPGAVAGSTALTPILNMGGSIAAKANALSRRGVRDDSLNFRLPKHWRSGTIELEVEGVGTRLECKEPADCKATVTFDPGSEIEVVFFKLNYKDSSSRWNYPDENDIIELDSRLKAIFPTSKVDRTKSRSLYLGTGIPQIMYILNELESIRLADCTSLTNAPSLCDSDRFYYGAIDQMGQLKDGTRLIGGRASKIGPPPVSAGKIVDNSLYGRNRHAHEIAHSMNRRHAIAPTSNVCNRAVDPAAPAFPFLNTVHGTTMVPTIGPLSPEEDVIFGWDTHRDLVVDPLEQYELMSYCGRRDRWISSFTYEHVRQYIDSTFSAARRLKTVDERVPEKTGSRHLQIPTEYCMYRGTIDLVMGTASFFPTLRFMTASPIPDGLTSPTGTFKFQTRDLTSTVITEILFAPALTISEENGDQIALFLLIAACDTGVATLKLIDDVGTELTSLSVSSSPPTVTVVYPNGGESLGGDTVVIKWTASDSDGGPLTFVVDFSTDNGTTWTTLAVDYPHTSVEVKLSDLAQSNSALIRVKTSDGYNTAEDISDATFTTPNNAPLVQITNRHIDGSTFVGVQQVTLEAFTFDQEDGELDDPRILWASDIDGDLGLGSELTVAAFELSETTHIITVTGTDSNNVSTSDSVTITIIRIFQPIQSSSGSAPTSSGGANTKNVFSLNKSSKKSKKSKKGKKNGKK